MYLFELWFSPDICPGAGLQGTSILFSTVGASIYIPANPVGRFPFLHTFSSIYKRTSILFSTVDASIYVPTNLVGRSPFLHTFSSICTLFWWWPFSMTTHLESDILECEVKWALGSITTKKASGGDGIPVELFQILKDDAVKVLHSICQQIWKTQQ